MSRRRRIILMLLAAVGLLVEAVWSLNASAELAGRLPRTPDGTDYQAWYDDELNLTWLVDGPWLDPIVPSGDGEIDWPTLANRLGFFSIHGFEGWRLPVLDANHDGVVVDCAVGPDSCTDNELQHFYLTVSAMRERATRDPRIPLPVTTPDYYWTGSACPWKHECRMAFGMFGPGGVPVRSHVANTHRVIVVRAGDVAPHPGSSKQH